MGLYIIYIYGYQVKYISENVLRYTAVERFGVSKFLPSLNLFDLKYSKNSNIVKYFYNCIIF